MNKIEEKYGLKPSHAYALFAILVLNVLWIISSVIVSGIKLPIFVLIPFIMFVAVVYYACYAYKKPHGNYLRYLILCFSAFSAIQCLAYGNVYPTYISVANYLVIILTAYMAGRLDHYKQNIIISTVVLACKCLMLYYLVNNTINLVGSISFVSFMALVGPVSLWLAIAGAYITRFKLHKQAGFEDKK